jgi:hypothetical protein
MVDELGALEHELAPLKPKIARAELLRSSVRAAYADYVAAEAYTVEGQHYSLSIGARAHEKKVDLPRLFRAIGPKIFLLLCQVTQKALAEAVPKRVPAAVAVECVSESLFTGTRPLKIFAKADVPAARKKAA